MANKHEAGAVTIMGIGEKLKKARESKSLTIDQAQRQTHIHQTVLIALEDGRCDEVLTPTYVKSFLKKYSDYLGLDTNHIIKDYASLHPASETSKVNISIDRDQIKRSVDMSGYIRFARNSIIIMILAVCIVLAVRFVLSFVFASRSQVPKKTKNELIKKVALPRAAAKKTRPASAGHLPAAVKKVEKAPLKTEEVQFLIPDKEPIRLEMTVKEQVFVGVITDGETQFKRSLPKGTIETFTAEKVLNISIARAKSVELVLNGKPLSLSITGQIKDLEITRKGFKVR
jgi:cytoskeleton protein RodZ